VIVESWAMNDGIKDLVVYQLSDRAVNRSGEWTSRLGSHSLVAGKVVS
jgi:hypothetical protein